MSFTNFLELELLDHVLGNSAYPAPATVYVGLSTTAPNDDGTNFTEPVGGAYARAAVTNNLTNWPAAVSGTKQNGTTITFPEATSGWLRSTRRASTGSPCSTQRASSRNVSFEKPLDCGTTRSVISMSVDSGICWPSHCSSTCTISAPRIGMIFAVMHSRAPASPASA